MQKLNAILPRCQSALQQCPKSHGEKGTELAEMPLVRPCRSHMGDHHSGNNPPSYKAHGLFSKQTLLDIFPQFPIHDPMNICSADQLPPSFSFHSRNFLCLLLTHTTNH